MNTYYLWQQELDRDGFVLLTGIFDEVELASMKEALARIFGENAAENDSIRSQEGVVYAARNVLRIWPEAANVWRRPGLTDRLAAALGVDYGLVRILFFDKPPSQSWTLPWHKDLTIAVRDNRLPSTLFGKPTRKAGVPHVEAPRDVLDSMLTARIHLDDVTDENGPLKVIPASHRSGKTLTLDESLPRAIHCAAGDVLLMRPLVAHCSGNSHAGTTHHRRVLHLEFAATPVLPDGYAWHDFLPGSSQVGSPGEI